MGRQLISLTPAAVSRFRQIMAAQGDGICGVRLGVKSTGCSGMSYKLDLAKAVEAGDEVIETDGIRVLIDPSAIMFVLGTEVDFVEDKLGAQFVFRNPNEKARCGCGESFTV